MSGETVGVRVPGRVNLIGEWIDFSGGTVLPMPIRSEIRLTRAPNGTDTDYIQSAEFGDEVRIDVGAPALRNWTDAIRGALQAARAMGWIEGGQDVTVRSDIPVGQGLSSSAATIVAALKACRPAGDTDDVALAQAARRVENGFMGVPCGIMDQMAVAVGRHGHVLALDTRDCSYELVPLPEDWEIVVIQSGVRRELADGSYKARQQECQAAMEALGTAHLCQADPAQFAGLEGAVAKRVRHVWTEGQRSLAAVAALKARDRAAFGALMQASHASLRDDMEVSVPVIDRMVEDAVALGADGARITGAGFGGCVVALMAPERAAAWWAALKARHPQIERAE
ncbi:MAG: galactokinase [Hyphomonas sp.]|nr:galactokinase [Hyphomonas sp.]